MKPARVLTFMYGVLCYVIFLFTFLYAIGFVGDLLVPKTVDSGAAGAFWPSLLVDLGLLGLFGLQHSVMARPGFKRRWTRLVPEPAERSTYVLFASLALLLLYRFWQPIPDTVWAVEGGFGRAALWGLFGLGWTLVLASTFMISHAHLFGLRQVGEYVRSGTVSAPDFQTPGLYRYMRHPIMAGFFIAFWATPEMTAGHLLFAVVTSAYILVALRLEERDLVRAFDDRYRRYREEVPMFVPRLIRKAARSTSETGDAT